MNSGQQWTQSLEALGRNVKPETLELVRLLSETAPETLQEIAIETNPLEILINGYQEFDLYTVGQSGDLESMSKALNTQRLSEIVETVRNPQHQIDKRLFCLVQAFIQSCGAEVAPDIDIIGLGDLSFGEFHLFSGGSILLLVSDGVEPTNARAQSRHLEATIQQLTAEHFHIDLNVLAINDKSLTSYSQLQHFELYDMNMKTRLKLHSSKSLAGRPVAADLVMRVAYALPLTPERFHELTLMRQIEAEHVPKKHLSRNIQVGLGSLAEIEWLLCLYELRYPDLFADPQPENIEARIHRLEHAKLINLFECEVLIEARRYLIQLSNHLHFLGYDAETLPENPDKLTRLASINNFPSGNEFLRQHEKKRDAIHGIYQEGLERLRV